MHRFAVLGTVGVQISSPSPSLNRKNYGYGQPFQPGYGQPFQPGYFPGQSVASSSHNLVSPNLSHQHYQAQRKASKQSEDDACLRDSIPAMRKPLAIVCVICNVFIPGLGTFIAGLTVLCCSEIRQKGATKFGIVRVNSGVALLQFLTAFLFLLGWIWSVMWGAAFITISNEFYKKSSRSDNDKQIPLSDNKPGTNSRSAHAQSPAVISTSEGARFPPSAHPIIVLQEPPVVLIQAESSEDRTKPILSNIPSRPQHRNMRRQGSETEVSPFHLTNETLQNIIIHDGAAPVANGNNRSDPHVPSGVQRTAKPLSSR